MTRAEAAEAIIGADGLIHGVVLRDLETGRTHHVQSHVVINAAGVWVDRVREAFSLSGQHLRPSRGSHLVLHGATLPLKAAVPNPAPGDGRPEGRGRNSFAAASKGRVGAPPCQGRSPRSVVAR